MNTNSEDLIVLAIAVLLGSLIAIFAILGTMI
jgi:hypothetical protein